MVFHIYQDVRSEWRWYLSAPDGTKLAIAGEGYSRPSHCLMAVERLTQCADARVVYDHVGPPHVNTASAGVFATALAR